MSINKQIMLDALKMEIMVIERGGYSPSVHFPHVEPRIFRDSVTCLNLGLADDKKQESCSACFLMDFVPEEYKNSEDDPCHKIPLNAQGDTVDSLVKTGARPEDIQAIVLAWLKATVKKLESDLANGK